jgi:hypothetical protein
VEGRSGATNGLGRATAPRLADAARPDRDKEMHERP